MMVKPEGKKSQFCIRRQKRMSIASSAVPYDALELIGEVAKRSKTADTEKLIGLVKSELTSRWPEDQRALAASSLRLGTDQQIREAVIVYRDSTHWDDVLTDYRVMHDVTEGAVRLIHKISSSHGGITDKEELFYLVCDWLTDQECSSENTRKYSRAKQMGLMTTKDVRYAIDLYESYLQYGYLKKKSTKKSRAKGDEPK
jgi:hypothetical protein